MPTERPTPDHSDTLWSTETDIYWQSATAYDAVLSFSKALEENHPFPSRGKIAASLANTRFAVDGATGIVKFDDNGDRIGAVGLVKVLPAATTSGESQYQFTPVFSD